jgi:hypothetical protein
MLIIIAVALMVIILTITSLLIIFYTSLNFLIILVVIKAFLKVLGLNPYYPAYYLATSLSMALTYICCQLNKDAVVTFYFSIALKAVYLPWALLLFYTLLGGIIYK